MSVPLPRPAFRGRDAVAFNLGHYEQMQVSIALLTLRAQITEQVANPATTTNPSMCSTEQLLAQYETVCQLHDLFAPHATITVIRNFEKE